MSLEDLARQHGAPDKAGIQRHQGEILRNAGNPPKCEPKLFGCSGGGFSTIYPQPGVQIRIQSANPNRHLRGNLKRFSPYPLEAPLTPSAPLPIPFLARMVCQNPRSGVAIVPKQREYFEQQGRPYWGKGVLERGANSIYQNAS